MQSKFTFSRFKKEAFLIEYQNWILGHQILPTVLATDFLGTIYG
jgi:hypothetical protein